MSQCVASVGARGDVCVRCIDVSLWYQKYVSEDVANRMRASRPRRQVPRPSARSSRSGSKSRTSSHRLGGGGMGSESRLQSGGRVCCTTSTRVTPWVHIEEAGLPEQCVLAMCTSSFRRTWQVALTIPWNVLAILPFRGQVRLFVGDCNQGESDLEMFLSDKCQQVTRDLSVSSVARSLVGMPRNARTPSISRPLPHYGRKASTTPRLCSVIWTATGF